ncbi:MAG: hypothetical protein P0Y65_03490 [Candidatus Devosia phytovorans]|uniref:Secreted protein n=1 Tax=Candidatus Devosia phytovorans TaxID=3121372 RepID=A0AAJ5VW89_9HYPH|nr:hypothetical protein [Devosia sp.]WEK05335.1 MAG: hypothetical protein P0Y65_03490 [Devosia sp.]
MHMKSLVSAGALAIALGLGAPAVMAQDAMAAPTMIGNQTLTEADATRVQTYCDDLLTASEQTDTATTGSEDAGTTESDTSENDADQAAVGGVDLDQVTIENCAEAGFVEGPVTPTP